LALAARRRRVSLAEDEVGIGQVKNEGSRRVAAAALSSCVGGGGIGCVVVASLLMIPAHRLTLVAQPRGCSVLAIHVWPAIRINVAGLIICIDKKTLFRCLLMRY
jgi:hypothetical protein